MSVLPAEGGAFRDFVLSEGAVLGCEFVHNLFRIGGDLSIIEANAVDDGVFDAAAAHSVELGPKSFVISAHQLF